MNACGSPGNSTLPAKLSKPFRKIPGSELDAHSLKDEMDAHGYLFIEQLLPRDDLDRLLEEITQIVDRSGWFLPGYAPLERMADVNQVCGDDEPSFKHTYEQIFNLELFHAFAHHPALERVMKLLVGPQLLVHPKPIVRLMFPNSERFVIHAHQDHQAIAGDAESFTAWMPLHDCPVELGPLQILEGSHRFGLQSADPKTGYISMETARGGDWVGGQINAGDLVIFHSLTVHCGSANISRQLRVSMDCRFQDYRRDLNPSTLVFAGSATGGRTWEKTYANWKSADLQYYWKGLPLRFRPSKAELAQLAQTADSEAMRARYARMLNLLELQMPD